MATKSMKNNKLAPKVKKAAKVLKELVTSKPKKVGEVKNTKQKVIAKTLSAKAVPAEKTSKSAEKNTIVKATKKAMLIEKKSPKAAKSAKKVQSRSLKSQPNELNNTMTEKHNKTARNKSTSVKMSLVQKTKPSEEKEVKNTVIKSPRVSKTKKAELATPASTVVPTKPVEETSFMTQLMSMGIPPYQITPGEAYMSEKQQEHFRHILAKWKAQLLIEMDRTMHHLQDEAANFPDPNDRATQEEEFSLELRARDRERKLIRKIEETLQKIDEGEYGYCDGCGVEIGIRRLEARPTANLCIDCKTLDEIREKQMGG
jgi:DnaK suppressor protein